MSNPKAFIYAMLWVAGYVVMSFAYLALIPLVGQTVLMDFGLFVFAFVFGFFLGIVSSQGSVGVFVSGPLIFLLIRVWRDDVPAHWLLENGASLAGWTALSMICIWVGNTVGRRVHKAFSTSNLEGLKS